jgi:hypothetical protein
VTKAPLPGELDEPTLARGNGRKRLNAAFFADVFAHKLTHDHDLDSPCGVRFGGTRSA